MKSIPKELLREYIEEEGFQTTGDVLNGLKSLFKQVLEEAMAVEMDEFMGREKHARQGETEERNYRNGTSKKTVRTELGEVELSIPRDRNGSFSPQIIPKHQRSTEGLDAKIINLYAAGMTTRDIVEQIRQLYDVEISADMVSRLTDRLLPELKAWHTRPLEAVYPFIFLDAVHYKVREDHQIISKAAYVVLGINLEGYKEILGIWIGGNESAKFWLSVLNDLKSRGVQTIHLCCVDGLSGFSEAIAAVYPKAQVQRCIVHQIRASTRHVSHKDLKAFCQDLKLIYTAVNEEQALEGLAEVKRKWSDRYPGAVKSWETNWENLMTFYAYPLEIRRIIYTTNMIEGVHRQLRKVTKTRQAFPTDDSLSKVLFMAVQNLERKWTVRCRHWDIILHQLEIMFPAA